MSGGNNKRANCTSLERNLAVNLTERYKHIIEDKSSKSDMRIEKKKEAWKKIAEEFNKSALITATVTPDQLRKLWQKLKGDFHHEKAANNREVLRTGGGPDATRGQLDPAIAAAAPYLLEPIPGVMDSDTAHLTAVRRTLAAAGNSQEPPLADPRLVRRLSAPAATATATTAAATATKAAATATTAAARMASSTRIAPAPNPLRQPPVHRMFADLLPRTSTPPPSELFGDGDDDEVENVEVEEEDLEEEDLEEQADGDWTIPAKNWSIWQHCNAHAQ